MIDGSFEIFSGLRDESYNGEINTYIDCVFNDNYDTDDIDIWIEVPKNLIND